MIWLYKYLHTRMPRVSRQLSFVPSVSAVALRDRDHVHLSALPVGIHRFSSMHPIPSRLYWRGVCVVWVVRVYLAGRNE